MLYPSHFKEEQLGCFNVIIPSLRLMLPIMLCFNNGASSYISRDATDAYTINNTDISFLRLNSLYAWLRPSLLITYPLELVRGIGLYIHPSIFTYIE